DDFFALGGDSISAMGLGTALRRKGYLLRPREIFALHTPARMAQAMQPLAVDSQAARSVQQGPIDGLPILHWFAETGDMHRRFAHGVFLRVPAELQPEQLRYALEQLRAAHPALGARIREGQLVVETAAAGELMQVHNVSGELELAAEQAFDAALDHLEPAAGTMMQGILLQRDGQSLGLVLAIHHLVVDGVSWRILLDELRQVADSAMQGQPITLPPEETSLYEWSARLRADAERREAELPFWRRMLADGAPRLGHRALDPLSDRTGDVSEKRTLLDSRLTAALLGTLPQGYRAQVEEIMLCALAQACRRRFQAASLRFSLESHGRAELDDGLDLARTVGWLTAEYPLHIELHDAEHNEAVRAVKRATRAVADRGVGYGQLRYLHPQRDELAALAQRNAPEILFNYLGRFSQDEGHWTPQRSQTRFRDAFAVAQDAQQALSYGLEVNIFVEERRDGACLAINWSWLEAIFSESDIAQLHSGLEQAVRSLCEFAERHPERAAATLVAAEIAQPNVADETVRAWEQECGPLAAALPLLPLQHGLLFHAQTAQQGGSYNSLTRLSLCGELDEHQLQQALNAVIRRHPQLAARFNREGEPLQLIPQESHWPLDSRKLPPLSEEQEAQALHELEQEELRRDLFNQPGAMLHALRIKHGDSERYTLFLNAHHLIVDGWSTPVVLNDLMLALREGEQALPPLRSNYADIVRRLTARDADASRRLWRETLQDVRPTLLFGESHNDRVHELEMTLPPAEERRLLTLCRERGLTLNTLMQGIWALQLASCCGHQDVVFGSPVSGRFGQIEGIEEHVGLFSNTLPVRVRLQHDRSLTDQLTELQHRQIELLEHDDLGLGEIQHLAGAGTLFDTLLVVENYPDNDALLGGAGSLRCDAIRNKGYTHYPLTLLVLPGERLRLLMEYRDSVPQPERFAARLMALLQQWIAQPDLPLPRWQLQTPQEQALVAAVNRTGQAVADTTLHQAIADQARRTPERIALQDAGHSLSYRDMQRQAALLAERLTAAGIQPGDIVAVALPRSVRLSLALTAIVQTGAAWLPLDTGYPDERLAYMVEDAKPRLIITESTLDARFAALAPTLRFDALDDSGRVPAPRPPAGNGDYPAYVLYTSGSTGRPKGVVVNHRAIVNRLFWMQHEYALDAQDVVLQKTPCSFDVSVWEFFWPLMVGARLVMAPPEAHRDPQALTTLIDDYGVTTLHFVPSMLAIWVEALNERAPQRAAASLKRVFCSGEALSCELASRYQALVAAPLHNLYGPTEAAVDVTYQPASGEALAAVSGAGVPIGKPVWNTQLSILDAMLRPVPVGCAGDLYLRGIQLADGYLHRPGLTAQRFVADPAGNGARMYRTGDIARWLEDGSVEYLGRSDDQLKIRGQRIELSEIDHALLSLPGVRQAVTHALVLQGTPVDAGGDARQLVGYLVMQPGASWDAEALRA
ncbi:amino acid adenylation domain-containing protein, partial [Serratia marcescens]